MEKESSSERLKRLRKQYVGKTGYLRFDGFVIKIKIKDIKLFFSRVHALITPTAGNGSGESWKYLDKINFDGQ